ncbi:MAG: ATP-grasp domain-containing protein [Myxococcota bacterium]
MERGILFSRPGPGSVLEDRFESEADVADYLGLPTCVVNVDLVVDREPHLATEDVPSGEWVYRGPILRAEAYEELASALAERGAMLFTEPAAYAHGHYLPEHYDAIADRTAESRWTYGTDVDEAFELARELGPGPYLLKDHVKSAKEAWEEACFVPAGADREAFAAVARGLLAERGDAFERGFVIRRFLELRTSGVRDQARRIPEEHRLYFVEGRLVAHAPYHGFTQPLRDLAPYAELGARIDSPFFAADVAFRAEDDEWLVVEVNDGGIAVPPEDLDLVALYEALGG